MVRRIFGAGRIDRDRLVDAAGMGTHDHDTVRQGGGLGDVVGD
jgi:hypothetical protein